LYSFHDDSPYIFPTTKTTFFRPIAIKRKERKKLKEKKRNEFTSTCYYELPLGTILLFFLSKTILMLFILFCLSSQ